jgi:U3 small nucleolar RNA-associated protein 3
VSEARLVHASRDQILLDGEDVQSDDEGEEEEVFALKGVSDEEDDDEDDDEDYDDHDQDEHDKEVQTPISKRAKQPNDKQKAEIPPTSDEDEREEEEEEGWGHKKSAYYSSNAAELDSEDEEANEMEEQEAKRLQAKLREGMTDEDFGLGDITEGLSEEPDA